VLSLRRARALRPAAASRCPRARADATAPARPSRVRFAWLFAPAQFPGLYRGMAAPLAGVAPMYALCFLGYGVGKKVFCDDDAFEKSKLVQIGLAGAVSSFFTTPILGPGARSHHAGGSPEQRSVRARHSRQPSAAQRSREAPCRA
jgi:hypothetical protein